MKEIDVMFQEINNIIVPISNFEWSQIVIHVIRDEMHSSIGIYYKFDDYYVFIQDLVENGTIDRGTYTMTMFNLLNVVIKLKKLFVDNSLDEWNSMIFSMKRNEDYLVYYSLEELDDSSMCDEVIWKYKYLGIMPNEGEMKYIEGVEQTLL